MTILTAPYLQQLATWPPTGRHILAQYDERSIIVYQAYAPPIAEWAIAHGTFGGPAFSFSRMSWVKPNFLWMMYRCGWASKSGQDYVLALRLRTSFFEEVLRNAVASKFDRARFPSREDWQRAVDSSEVRLQWDPDHDPYGKRQERRALQIGLRGSMLERYATTELLEVVDMTPFVVEQRRRVQLGSIAELLTPHETVYQPVDADLAARLDLDTHPGQ